MKTSMRLWFTVIVLALLALPINPIAAADGTYYVAANGSDTNTGTSPDSPWRLSKAVSSAPEGSTILFRGGTYRGIDLNVSKRFTLEPYNGETVIFKGSEVIPTADWIVDGGRWRKDNWTYQFPPPSWEDPEKYLDDNYPMANHRDMVFIDGVALKQVGTLAEVSAGEFYVDYAGDKLYIGSNPNGKTVEATNKATGLSLSAPYTVMRGLNFTHYAESGVRTGADHILLENNTFTWNGITGVYLLGQWGDKKEVSTDIIVRGNTFSYNGRNGIGGSSAHRMILEDNLIDHNNVERFSRSWAAGGVKVTQSDYIIWRNNVVEYNYATGMWMDVGTDHATVVHNFVRDNDSLGIFFEISNYAIIAGNVSVDNSTNIQISNSSNAKIYNNTMVRGGTSLKITESDRQPESWEDAGTFQTRKTVVINNLIANSAGSNDPQAMVDTWMHDHPDCATVVPMIKKFDYNGYFRTDGSVASNLIRWVKMPVCYGIFPTLAAFKQAAKVEKHGIEQSGAANTFFINEAGGDYHLKADSPVVGAGKPLPLDVAKALGWQPGVRVDLGALQRSGLLTNGGFEFASSTNAALPGGWKTGSTAGLVCNKGAKVVAYQGSCAFRLQGGTALAQKLYPYGLSTGDTITLNAAVSGKKVVAGGVLQVKIKYMNGGGSYTLKLDVPAGTYDYQPLTVSHTLTGRVKKLSATFRYAAGAKGSFTLDALNVSTTGAGAGGLLPLPVRAEAAQSLIPLPLAPAVDFKTTN